MATEETTIMSRVDSDSTKYIKVGPAGLTETNDHPTAWDEKGHTKISRIYISYEPESITSIQFQYVEDGNFVLSPVYIERLGGSKFRQCITCCKTSKEECHDSRGAVPCLGIPFNILYRLPPLSHYPILCEYATCELVNFIKLTIVFK
ncbi:uncharacterized protein LOC104888444 isoform X2 [Beta vulgaris subsp. vulgaris]|uniref:uncharacterized protein LOC104888444 isoform X2 n=1 Tax=Beta vulgaris subsp. vulgaris TaxID=3555 RepID=UPI0020371B2E|nr:uncharacterized protein LOC104888444 isoform X2 [Beta vulgaris subsp. vulgaris]